MTWTHADTGSYLSREIDGTDKSEPTLWLPKERQLFIPETDQDHGRPVIVLKGDDPETTFALVLFRNRIEGRHRGTHKTLVEI